MFHLENPFKHSDHTEYEEKALVLLNELILYPRAINEEEKDLLKKIKGSPHPDILEHRQIIKDLTEEEEEEIIN
ncbi:hypothetical protein H6761_04140 [Candidatus Nomurabacteria bacterium]|nr:hypothetical protein [Candidatus Nomurabacteria bacterium]